MSLVAVQQYIRQGRTAYVGDISGIPQARANIEFAKKNNGRAAREFRASIAQKAGLSAVPDKILTKADLVKRISRISHIGLHWKRATGMLGVVKAQRKRAYL